MGLRTSIAKIIKLKSSLYLSLIWGCFGFWCAIAVVPTIASLASAPPEIANAQTNPFLAELERGKQFYNAGKFTDAVSIWAALAARADLETPEAVPDRQRALVHNFLGLGYQELGEFERAQTAIARAELLARRSGDRFVMAQVLNTRGSYYLKTGSTEEAVKTWEAAEAAYREADDLTGVILTRIDRAQALQNLGLYRQARDLLEQVARQLDPLPNSALKVRGLQSLATSANVVGDRDRSQALLTEALAIARSIGDRSSTAAILFQLGNTTRSRGDLETAADYYTQAIAERPESPIALQARLNRWSLWVEGDRLAEAKADLEGIRDLLQRLAPSRFAVYGWVNFSETAVSFWRKAPESVDLKEIAVGLATAADRARSIADPRAESYALGELGYLYEQTGQWEEAEALTRRALMRAEAIGAREIAAIWEWQQGRLLKARGEGERAIVAYEEAVKTLTSLRRDLLAIDPEVQFSFRDRVEPVYRQLVALLLQDVDRLEAPQRQARLERSRQLVEALQLAELDNFFREVCLDAEPRAIDAIDPQAAAIYPIVLDRSLSVIVSLPGKPLRHYRTDLSEAEMSATFKQLRQSLNPVFLPEEVLPSARTVYDWLIRPIADELERSSVETLVFVLDGFLRSLPMAVLHDGDRYLVEKYNIALAPGLHLVESDPLQLRETQTLAAGLSEARQGFSALPEVTDELNDIRATVGARVLLNQEFERDRLEKNLKEAPISIVHLATHGQFSSKAEETFLLTWNGKINVKDLDRLLNVRQDRIGIELLVLSACQTAKGDDRAALGLAGVAVRSGARSTVATLWSVQDRSTANLMEEFYRLLLQPGMTKAQALRQAQQSLLSSENYRHPYYWAPFVLVGNWR